MKNQRFDSLDILKSIAIICVVLNHSLTSEEMLWIGGPFWIYMAVPIFLIISGFNMYRSIEKRNMTKMSDYFNKPYLWPKLVGILLPWLLAIFIISFYQIGINDWTIAKIIEEYIFRFGFTGGYYIAILLQFHILFPFLYKAFQKNRFYTSIGMVGGHLLFDYLVNIGPLSNITDIDRVYRVAIFRYLVFILAGIWLAAEPKNILNNAKRYYKLAIVSIVYIVMNSYTPIKFALFREWNWTALPVVFLAFAIVVLFMKNENQFIDNFLSRMGEHTYFIYVAQMLFFEIEASEYLRHTLVEQLNLPLLVPVALDVILCIIGGCVFSFLYSRSKLRGK